MSPAPRAIAAIALVTVTLAGCGSPASSSPPAPAPHVLPTAKIQEPQAVATARKFLRAFQAGDRRSETGLMSPSLRVQLRHHTLAHLLGVRTRPRSFDILGTVSHIHAGESKTVVVTAGLHTSSGVVAVRLTMLETPNGRYGIVRIEPVGAVG